MRAEPPVGGEDAQRGDRPVCARRYKISIARKSLTLVCVGPVTTQVADRVEVAVGVVAVEVVGQLQARACGARQRVGRDEGAGVVLDAVDAVGVGRQRPHVRPAPCSARARPRQNSPARPPRPLAAPAARPHRDRGLAARQDHAGPGEGLAAVGHRARQRRVHLADLARLAFDLVAEDVRLDAGGARRRGSGFERLLRRGDQVRSWPANTRVAGLGRFQRAALQPAHAPRRGTSMP